ncbi:MAG TPA: response regulator [Terriglobia bacterium]|nr:response regulator [Terriglobia bacterium]
MQTRHILLVDDSKDNRELYEYFLSLKGFRVTSASDGEEALNKAFELQPDLVVMDLSLPGISGWEATRRLKADERTKRVPVVILSAYDFSGATAELGCEGFLVKPCLPDAMISEIARVLGKQAKTDRSATSSAPAPAEPPGP